MQPSPWSMCPFCLGRIPRVVVTAPGVQMLASLLPPSSLAELQPEADSSDSPRAAAWLSPIWRMSLVVKCGVTFAVGISFKQRRPWRITQRQRQTLHQPPWPVLFQSIIAVRVDDLISPQRHLKLLSLKSCCALEQ